MGKNFFLDNDYTQKQVESINKVKSKKPNNSRNNNVNGNSNSIFDDINSYKNDKNKQTDNSELFDYIEKTMGMDNFLELLDADGDGKISKSETNKMSSYDGDDKLSSKDINKFVDNTMNLKNATSTTTNGNFDTKINYETDKNGQLIKTSATRTENKTKTDTNEYIYDEHGNITSEINKLNNRTTNYEYKKDASGKYIRVLGTVINTKTKETTSEMEYDNNGNITTLNDLVSNRTTKYEYDKNGKKISSKTTANDKNNTLMYESTYDENDREKNRKEYFNLETGERFNSFQIFTYDDYGRPLNTKIYEGSDDKGKLIGDYEYTYATDKFTYEISSIKNKLTNETKEYIYNEDHELTDIKEKDEDGKTLRTYRLNKNGTFASMTEDDYTYIYEYEEGGIRSKATKYNKSDVDDNGKPKSDAKVKEEITYKDGKEDKKTVYDDDGTKYYQGGELTAEVKGEYTYVYEYDSNGKKTTKKYNSSDCVDGVPNKSAQPITTSVLSDSIVELAESLIGSNAQDGSADKFVEGVGDDASTTAWCSEFAKYVLQNCGHYDELPDWYKNLPDTRDDGKNAACSIHQAAKDAGAVVSAAEAQPGDLVLFRDDSDSLASHTGLVLKIENGKLYTIEGNTLGEGGRSSVRTLTYDDINSDKFVYCKVTP